MSDSEESFEEKLRKFRLERKSDDIQTEATKEESLSDMGRRRGSGGRRPPAHLKGREIGMFYANRQRKQNTSWAFDDSGPYRTGKKHRRQKVRERVTYENDEVGIDSGMFMRFDDSGDEDVVRGIERKPPPGLTGREIGLYYRDRKTEKKKEKEKRRVVDITIPQWQIQEIRKLLNLHHGSENVDFFKHFIESDINSPFKNEYLRVINTNIEQNLRAESLEQNAPTDYYQTKRKQSLNEDIYQEFIQKEVLPEMKASREKLPAFGSRYEILNMIDKHQVILIKGETGSGKTTQIPQFILDHAIIAKEGSDCRIICTQPRRISAITLSERVATERGERLGQSVGYQIRLDGVKPRSNGATITYCTTGIVLTMMQSDPILKGISHLILDEIHERDVVTDLLLAIVKMVLTYRKDLKVILMSATLTAETFSRYFNNCPTVEIPGLLFPVQEFYLEDIISELNYHNFNNPKKAVVRRNRFNSQFLDMIEPYIETLRDSYSPQVIKTINNPESETNQDNLIVELILNITATKPDGAILVFFPSLAQITEVNKLLTANQQLSRYPTLIYPLHSKVPQLDQKAVFSRPTSGTRKIILATNIAETSITIDDVVYVINTGKHKINMYENGIASLRDEWISLSNEIQRKGRAGRVKPGISYHLYSRARRSVLLQNTPPEILRVALDEVILNIKILGLGEVRRFMDKLLDRPTDEVIEESLQLLNRLNALDDDQVLTPLGYHLARLPMDPRTGKMVLLSSIFSCIDPITSIAASLSFKDAFYKPFGKEKQVDAVRRKFAEGHHSDHLMLANVIHQWKSRRGSEAYNFARQNFLNVTTLKQLCSMKQQFCEYLYFAKFLQNSNIESRYNNLNSGNDKLLTALIGAGLYPNVAFVRKVIRNRKKVDGRAILAIEGQGRAVIHPCSVNATLADFESNFVVYYEKQKISSLTMFDTTVVNPFPLFFFGDNHVETEGEFEYISIAGHYGLRCDKETYRLIQDLRGGFNLFLQKKICHPSPVDWSSDEGTLLSAIIQLVTIDGKYEDNFGDDDLPAGCSGNPEEIPLDDDDDDYLDYYESYDMPEASTSSRI
ncbi:ATP-dependent DNA/RNA helicase DHX36 [Topomyia yanbarensis]|uniref:ATP-dependent DNA/RNA helicase DHX36 n=1 Tax=Topomyia yanbarensis TaxID=2498891 RepID=UPI00273BAE5C|nr:ATP-dependent DNA/RNA helicase DHX36 [Topomyia yanbarensis]